MDADGSNRQADHQSFDRSRRRAVFARRQEPGLHQRCFPGLRRRRRAATRAQLDAEKSEQSEGAHLHRACSTGIGITGRDRTRSHLMVIPVSRRCGQRPDARHRDVPPFSLGGRDDYAISPDSKEVCYCDERRCRARHQHQYGSLCGADRRRPGAQDHQQSRRGQRAAVFAGRQISRLARASPAGL